MYLLSAGQRTPCVHLLGPTPATSHRRRAATGFRARNRPPTDCAPC
jgi:hypothetical protein